MHKGVVIIGVSLVLMLIAAVSLLGVVINKAVIHSGQVYKTVIQLDDNITVFRYEKGLTEYYVVYKDGKVIDVRIK